MRTIGPKMFAMLFHSLCLVGLLWTGVYAAGFEYPNRAITFVVPFPAGGVTDLSARTLAEAMEKHLKQPVVVINKPGGRTTVGGYAVATAKPDGYTLGFFPISASIPEAYSYFQEAPYSSKDLLPICSIAEPIQTWVVKEDAPWNNLKDLVDFARKNPGVKVSTGGKQTEPLCLGPVNRKERVGFVGVAFSGDATNLTAILGGHVPVAILDYTAAKTSIDAKKLKPLACCSEKRADFAPDLPTIVELGYELTFLPLVGVFAPRGTPDEVVKKIDALAGKITEEQDFRNKLNNMSVKLNYRNAATYQKNLERYIENIKTFFKEEGLVK